ncbi:DCC1-like thiol-disulfide oxidoreductase family protein [Halorussus salinus]|uniref:DCC1-like thiol-disulfide oxidoreductase family protein n=1 Tax=Halorussus salinus TaxID=1364935 RepID=UPI001091F0F5|nr:DCC1-like thiol-disulfide oxidoreductase family protein [Halorussus salinus]
MTDYHAVLVYDGECPFCSAAATALRRLDGVGAIAWDDEPARRLLEAQFGETPFALVLVDGREECVYVGREAARELCERAGMPVLVQDIVGDNYESLADAIRSVTGVEGDPDPYHGEYPLSEAGKEAFEALAANAWHTAKVSR